MAGKSCEMRASAESSGALRSDLRRDLLGAVSLSVATGAMSTAIVPETWVRLAGVCAKTAIPIMTATQVTRKEIICIGLAKENGRWLPYDGGPRWIARRIAVQAMAAL